MLSQARWVLETVEDSLHRDAFSMSSPEFLGSMTLEFPTSPRDAFDALLLISWARYDRRCFLLESVRGRFRDQCIPMDLKET